jgi:hypothetical protein
MSNGSLGALGDATAFLNKTRPKYRMPARLIWVGLVGAMILGAALPIGT